MTINNAPRQATIYALYDPGDLEHICYIGQTRQTPARRLTSGHLHEARRYKRPHNRKDAWLRALEDRGGRPVIRVLEVVSLGEANHAEKRLIEEHREQGHPLLNGAWQRYRQGRHRIVQASQADTVVQPVHSVQSAAVQVIVAQLVAPLVESLERTQRELGTVREELGHERALREQAEQQLQELRRMQRVRPWWVRLLLGRS